MTCPGCSTHSSSVLYAYREDRPCPECGLSNEAMAEILDVQRSRADEKLKTHLAEEIKRRGIAEAKVARLEYRLGEVRNAMDAPDPEWLAG